MKIWAVTAMYIVDDEDTETYLFSTKGKAIDFIKYLIKLEKEINSDWVIDDETYQLLDTEDAGNVILFWNKIENWNTRIEITWQELEVDRREL